VQVDLSFPRLSGDGQTVAMSPDLAVMMVGIAARQATSPTALINDRDRSGTAPAVRLLAPVDGAFHSATAEAITRWKQE